MKATVVIVTYNRLKLLKECLSCVDNQILKFENIVIVDNNSTDGTKEFLHTCRDKYNIVFQSENGGGAKGFKVGIEYVYNNLKTDWILVIDDDAMLSTNYLYEIDKFARANPKYLALSGSVITEGIVDVTHRKRVVSSKYFNFVPVAINEYDNPYFEYDLSSFCGLLFHTSLISKIGYPKEEYFIWFDDTEYSLRIRKETCIININSAKLNHKTKINTGSVALNWRGYYGIRNGGDVVKRYGTKSQYSKYRQRVRIAQYKNLLLYLLTFKSKYRYNANLYNDALKDLKIGFLGYNTKYHA